MNIVLKNVKKSYRDADKNLVIMNDTSFCFPSGRTIAIVGRSGVGKSTLLHLLGALDTPDSGEIFFNNTSISTMTQDERAIFRGKNIGYIFQGSCLLPEFSAAENVAMPLVIQGIDPKIANIEASNQLKYFGLASRVDHLPSELSGGEQQRVAIARATITNPAVILADEPTGNLDFATATEVLDFLKKINKDRHTTFIIVTHSRELASSMDIICEMLPGGSLNSSADIQSPH